ncbi:MAG: hypothetical protein DRJ30_07010 [Candidatus Methanomethylicota archaeon]|nr:MAG: hypothetical protein DRJ30_07010 [Candidatus Verstraetearchaeota archaeon]
MQSKQLQVDLSRELGRLKTNYELLKEIIYELEENYVADFEKLSNEICFLKKRIRQLEKIIEKLQDQRPFQAFIQGGE